MRRKDREITDVQEMREILAEANVCRIALCDGDRPYIVPMSFGIDGNRIYFHCAPVGKKLELIRANPNICFEVDVDVEVVEAEAACEWTARYRSVIGQGRASLVEDPAEKAVGMTALMRQYSESEFEFSEEVIRSVTIVRMEIESMTGKKAGFQS